MAIVQIAPTMNRMRRQRVNVELAAVARAITRSSFATRRVNAWAFVIEVMGCFWSIAPTLLDGGECVNSSRMLKSHSSHPPNPSAPRRAFSHASFSHRSEAKRTEAYAFASSLAAAALTVILSILRGAPRYSKRVEK
jgi:hypothetical protein